MPATTARTVQSFVALQGERSGAWLGLQMSALGQLYTRQWGDVETVRFTDLNDSDKTITIPAAELWLLHYLGVDFTATATVGDRELRVDYRDDNDDVLASFSPEAKQSASSQRFYGWGNGIPHQITPISDVIIGPLPWPSLFPAGHDLRVYDMRARDAAADDMILSLVYSRYDP